MKHYSRDGSFYGTLDEAMAANTRYDQQQKQNNLLEEQLDKQERQNYLLEQQLKQQQNQIDDQIRLEINRQKQEEELRLLKYFDGLNIVKKEYDRFISKILVYPNKTKKILELEKEVDALILKNIKLSNKIYIQSEKENNLIQKQKNLQQKLEYSNILYITSGIFCVMTFLISIINFYEFYGFMLFAIIPGVLSYLSKKENGRIKNDLNKYDNINNKKSEDNNEYEDMENNSMQIELKKKAISKYENEEIKKNWNKFMDFRLKHYNIKIENLFINVGLDDYARSCGMDYIKITEKNFIKKGTTNDYLEIFQNFETFENYQN